MNTQETKSMGKLLTYLISLHIHISKKKIFKISTQRHLSKIFGSRMENKNTGFKIQVKLGKGTRN